MAGETLDIMHILGPDNLAVEIANRWREWSELKLSGLKRRKSFATICTPQILALQAMLFSLGRTLLLPLS
jgi:hypothetical protein